ncbi:MAG: hypothetical protein PHE54_03425 [Bacilli bacterium]|nr:hypothetical protein [Bacilli bacterium]
MKKIFLCLLTLLITGCTVVRIDTNSIDNIVAVVLSKENKLYNQVGKGYKYYVPRGVNYLDTNEYNDKLYSNGNYYYLYIDVISYYYQTTIEHDFQSGDYYTKTLDQGYIEITKQDNQYLIEFMYNYAKIEALVDESDIEEVILNASYILSTIKYNDNVIKLMLDEDFFTNKEEKYNVFSSSEYTSN